MLIYNYIKMNANLKVHKHFCIELWGPASNKLANIYMFI